MDLHIKYRPNRLEDVLGQPAVVRSLSKLLTKSPPHTYLFSGPSGVGKTTLARIVAGLVRASTIEVDAATYTGIGDMRTVVESLPFKSWDRETPNKCVIIDECHALSRQAFQSLLKIIEEPPKHVFFCLCTTEVDKVPKTILTRSHHYGLRSVSGTVIEEYLLKVAKLEGFPVDEEIIEWIAYRSAGSVRQALVYLSMCHNAKQLHEAKAMVSQVGEGTEAVTLFRSLVSGEAKWQECTAVLKQLEDKDGFSYESLRIGLVNYVGVVLMSAKSEGRAKTLLAILEAFSLPLNKSTERSGFLLAMGVCVLT